MLTIMQENEFPKIRRPNFYKRPSQEDIETNGWAAASIHANVRARIIGSRVLASSIVFTTGTILSAQELFSLGFRPTTITANYLIPAVVNGLAEIKVERQLRHTERDINELLPYINSDDDGSDNII